MSQPISNKLFFVVAASCIVAFNCSDEFNPAGPVDKHLCVFAVFSTDRDVQVVRVTAPYMPSNSDPTSYTADNTLTDATVTIYTPRERAYDTWNRKWYWKLPTPYQFHDTILVRTDTSRYKSPLHAYALSSLTLESGKTYFLSVSSPSHGGTSTDVSIPNRAVLAVPWATNDILFDPLRSKPDAPIAIDVKLSTTAAGYLARLIICYDVLKGSEWVSERFEVPITSADAASYSLDSPKYPELAPITASTNVRVTWQTGYLQNIIRELTTVRYANTRLIYKYVVFQVAQADANLYGYYSSVREYQDPHSIRLDEPPFPKIAYGAYGMVGVYTLDSSAYYLPENFNGNR